MNDDIKDILLELEDEGYDVKYNNSYGSRHVSINISNKLKFKLKKVKDILLRLSYYKNHENINIQISTINRIVGAQRFGNQSEFLYTIKVDTEFFDGLYTERGRYNDNPLYIKNSIDLDKVHINIW